MSNVINMADHESCCYTEYGGVKDKHTGLTTVCNSDCCIVTVGHFHVQFRSRKELAEWLWMSVRLVDSEGRYEKDKYVGLNYE